MNGSSYDAVIVGAGAAGAIAAYDLAKSGARVLIIEKEKLPRYKPCGGGLTEKVRGLLPFDISPVVEQTVHQVRFTCRLGERIELRYPKPLMYTVMRARFDQFLVERALEVGARLIDGVAVKGLVQDGRLGVSTEKGSHEAAVVIGADGANGIIARSLGLMSDVHHLVAWETEIEPEPGTMTAWAGVAALDLGSLPSAYAWVFPKKGRLSIGAGGFGRAARGLRGYSDSFLSRQNLGPHRVLVQKGHLLPLRRTGSPIYKGRVALVGDAAGLIDAFTGEGVYWALASGQLAAASALDVLAGRAETLAAYQETVDRKLMPELIYSRRWVNIYHWSPGFCYRLLRDSSRFRDATARILRGEKSYASIERAFGPLGFLAHLLPDPT